MAFYIDGQEILTLNIDGVKIETLNIDGVTVARKPTITTQPVGGTITDAESKTISVVADGLDSTMTYQWYKSDGTVISGATGTSYTFTPPETGSFGFYCRVTGFGGYTQTNTVTVVVESAVVAPVIITSPSSGSINEDEDYTTSITVDWGGESGTIIWYLDDAAQPSSNATSFTFTSPSIGAHVIRAEATNSKGMDVSENANLTVNEIASVLTVGEYSASGTVWRGYEADTYGSLTNSGKAVRPDGSLESIYASNGIIEGNTGSTVIGIYLSTGSEAYTNVNLAFTSDTVNYNVDIPVDGNFGITQIPDTETYAYALVKQNENIPDGLLSIRNEMWNNVGNDYNVKFILS
ncbi:hypothetical protein [Vibrio parahaemolyticus]|uniref:hypothetical protein n=1 Tax=Vibrio parahaemolyticus TaxID=670 RepID=UPI000C9CEE02|nr:hypothetical protein [Vibrio parahaemolyticus]PMS91965.1 hypothetical protein C1T06_23015 [Vibrio parahaemolyticus]